MFVFPESTNRIHSTTRGYHVLFGPKEERQPRIGRRVRIDPNYFDAHFAVANLLSRCGQYELAASHYARVNDYERAKRW